MECWTISDQIQLLILFFNIVLIGVFGYHAILFRSQSKGIWKSIGDAKEKERKELRAYLSPTGRCVISENKLIPYSSIRSFWIDAKIDNSGLTSAVNVIYKWKVEPINTDSFKGDLGDKFNQHSLPDIGPRHNWKITGSARITDCKWQEIIVGNSFVNYAFFGVIEYDDVFTDHHIVPFAFVYNRDNSIGGEKMNWIQPKKEGDT